MAAVHKKWLLYGGLAAGGGLVLYKLLKPKPKSIVAGVRGLGAWYDVLPLVGTSTQEVAGRYDSLSVKYQDLVNKVQGLPANIKSAHMSVLNAIYKDLLNGYNGMIANKNSEAMKVFDVVDLSLTKLYPVVAADVANPGAGVQVAKARIEEIQRLQAAFEPERQAAEQGFVPYVGFKAGQAAGAAVEQLSAGASNYIKNVLKSIPWWVWLGGVGVAGFLAWPYISPAVMWASHKVFTPKPANLPRTPSAVRANPCGGKKRKGKRA